jgi:hypothetical protein
MLLSFAVIFINTTVVKVAYEARILGGRRGC